MSATVAEGRRYHHQARSSCSRDVSGPGSLRQCQCGRLSHAYRMYLCFSFGIGEDRPYSYTKDDGVYYHDGQTETTMHEFHIAYYKGMYLFILYISARPHTGATHSFISSFAPSFTCSIRLTPCSLERLQGRIHSPDPLELPSRARVGAGRLLRRGDFGVVWPSSEVPLLDRHRGAGLLPRRLVDRIRDGHRLRAGPDVRLRHVR